MSTLKERINADYITAWKGKDEQSKIAKNALNNLKSKITEAELTDKGKVELTDDEVLKVVTKAIKQRKDSIEQFEKGGRTDLAESERAEMKVFEVYMPKQQTRDEIVANVTAMLPEFPGDTTDEADKRKKMGQMTGKYNKTYAGGFDMSILKSVLEELV